MLKKNSENFHVKLKFNIKTQKYMKESVPLLTDMEFKWIEDDY